MNVSTLEDTCETADCVRASPLSSLSSSVSERFSAMSPPVFARVADERTLRARSLVSTYRADGRSLATRSLPLSSSRRHTEPAHARDQPLAPPSPSAKLSRAGLERVGLSEKRGRKHKSYRTGMSVGVVVRRLSFNANQSITSLPFIFAQQSSCWSRVKDLSTTSYSHSSFMRLYRSICASPP